MQNLGSTLHLVSPLRKRFIGLIIITETFASHHARFFTDFPLARFLLIVVGMIRGEKAD